MDSKIISQLKVLIIKNLKLKKKNKKMIYYVMFIYIMVALSFVFMNVDESKISITKNDMETDLSEAMVNTNLNLGFVIPPYVNENLISQISNNTIFKTPIKTKSFKTEKELDNYIKKNNEFDAGVIFNSNFNYTIRINKIGIVDPYDRESNSIFDLNQNIKQSKIYLTKFVPIQLAVDQAIINLNSNLNNTKITSYFGKLSGVENNIEKRTRLDRISDSVVVLILFMFFMGELVIDIVYEKEKNIDKQFRINGLKLNTYILSWEIYAILYSLFLTILFTIVSLIVYYSDVLAVVTLISIPLTIFLSTLVVYSLTVLLSAFFKKMKTASNVIVNGVILIFYLMVIINVFVEIDNIPVKIIISIIFPPYGSLLAINEIRNISSISEVSIYLGCLLVNYILIIVITFITYNYMEKPKKVIKNNNELVIKNSKDNYSENIENISENDKKCMVEVSNLFKVFKSENDEENIIVLDNINFKVYQGEIFGILGHNGAGKTTLINIMIGLLNSESGNVFYEGLDIGKHKETINSKFGVCPQNDVLYDDLTINDHITLYSKIKNQTDTSEIEELLNEIGLNDKRNTLIKNLSGGQKRKLSIIIPFIGNSKYIFLDEPTTGLDPLSRRKMWDLLSKRKKDRVIFLTTHYMDEADILTDRKLILVNGKIQCLGSSLFLKNHFNMEYVLDVETSSPDLIKTIVESNIPDSKFIQSKNENVNDNKNNQVNEKLILNKCYKWKLPMASSTKYADLFTELEKYNEKGIINQFSITLPTLEELFIKLEVENQKKNILNNNINEDNENSVLLIKSDNNELPQFKPNKNKKISFSTFKYLVMVRIKLFIKNKAFAFTSLFLPVLFSVIIFFLINQFNIFAISDDFTFTPNTLTANNLYKNNLWNFDNTESTFNIINNTVIKDVFPKGNLSLTNYDNEKMNEIGKNIQFNQAYYVASFSGEINNNDDEYNLNIHYNESLTHSIPATINLLSNSILFSQNSQESISVVSYPFPDLQSKRSSYVIIMFYVVMFLVIVFVTGISFFGPMIIRERVTGIAHQLQLNGLSRKNYWLSSLTADFLVFLIPTLLIIVVGAIFKFEIFINIKSLLIMIITILLWIVSSLLFQYVTSFFFSNVKTAYSNYTLINITFVVITLMIFLVVEIIGKEMISLVFKVVMTLIHPNFGLAGQIYQLLMIKALKQDPSESEISLKEYMELNNGVLLILIILVVDIIYLFLVLIYQNKSINQIGQLSLENSNQIKNEIENSDEDVKNEKQYVENNINSMPVSTLEIIKEFKLKTPENEEYEITTESGEIIKKYRSKKTKMAVRGITFGVKNKECFGLLGPNGAGKTSTLDIITSKNIQTYGRICYDGIDNKNIDVMDLSLGYCSQENSLYKELSLYEHIELFLRINGCDSNKVTDYTKKYIEYFELQEYTNKKVSKLSGGTKRKLSLIIAIIGSAKLIILDEPTAGMDPFSRILIWNIIDDISKTNSSIVLTTHSLEEAERLCDRIGILVNGQFVCIGRPEHLKMKYGENYILEVECDDIERFDQEFVIEKKLLGDKYKCENKSLNRIQYEILINSEISISKIFKIMENIKAQKVINDYSFNQATLEQIFINFAKKQK